MILSPLGTTLIRFWLIIYFGDWSSNPRTLRLYVDWFGIGIEILVICELIIGYNRFSRFNEPDVLFPSLEQPPKFPINIPLLIPKCPTFEMTIDERSQVMSVPPSGKVLMFVTDNETQLLNQTPFACKVVFILPNESSQVFHSFPFN